MHDSQRSVRAHRHVARQLFGDDGDDAAGRKTAVTTAATTKAAATTTTPITAKIPTATSALTTPAAVKTTTSTSTPATTSSTALIDISSLLGLTSSTSKTSTSSSTTSSLTTTSSTSSTVPATSAAATSVQRQLTSTATLTTGTSSAASSTGTSSPNSGLSGAETGGIVAGCVLAGLALLIYVIRKTFIQRRKRKRNTWGVGVYPDINDKYVDTSSDLPPPLPEKAPSSNGYLEPRTPIWAPPRPVSPNPPMAPPSNSYYVQPPQASYNNAMMDGAPGYASAAPVGPASQSSFGSQSAGGEMATVRVLYVPSLPDELSITQGEVVQVVQAYDDGWALCSNARGEQGVVPLECLDRASQNQADRLSVGYGQQESGGDWRNMKRMSSLSTQQPHY